MISSEGYKAFYGTMRITPKNPNMEPFDLTCDWLYKPEYQCWYGNGSSFMEEICTVLVDLTTALKTGGALDMVRAERCRQDSLWGDQSGNHPLEWMSILGEEYGELCEAVNETFFKNATHPDRGGYEKIVKEATHVAAVAVAIIETTQRKLGETLEVERDTSLTLDELLEMDGEPVYCISDYEITVNGEKGHRFHAEGWGIVTGTDLKDQGFIVGTAYIYHLEHYGKTWLAYRRKPEEAALPENG